jgi:hypothetical protein
LKRVTKFLKFASTEVFFYEHALSSRRKNIELQEFTVIAIYFSRAQQGR